MKYLFLVLAALLLNGCLLGTMENITRETRDEVKKTRDKTEHGTKIEMASSRLFNSDSLSARSAGFMMLLKELEMDQLGSFLPHFGIPVGKLDYPVYPLEFRGTTITVPNVVYVGKKNSLDLGISPTSPEVFDAMVFGTLKMLSILIAKTSASGVEDMAEYRQLAEKLVLVAPAILGAASLDKLIEQLDEPYEELNSGAIAPQRHAELAKLAMSGGFPLMLSEEIKERGFSMMETLAKNTSLSEDVLRKMKRLSSLRMGD